MNLIEFVDSLNLPFKGELVKEEDNEAYIINMKDSNAWDRLFITLESNENLSIDEEKSTAVLNVGSLLFIDKSMEFYVKLLYNFNDDIYQCRIEVINEEIS